MTATETATALAAAFPGAEFRVRQEYSARGTNETIGYVSVSYNVQRDNLDLAAVYEVAPEAMIWVRGKRS